MNVLIFDRPCRPGSTFIVTNVAFTIDYFTPVTRRSHSLLTTLYNERGHTLISMLISYRKRFVSYDSYSGAEIRTVYYHQSWFLSFKASKF